MRPLGNGFGHQCALFSAMSLISGQLQAPTSSLPPLRSLDDSSEEVIFSALRNLYALYCPLSSALIFQQPKTKCAAPVSEVPTPLVDSGYVSGDEDEEKRDDADALEMLRADSFERNHATSWLTGFIARAEGLSIWSAEEACESAIDQASYVLASFSSTAEENQDDDDIDIVRNFSFDLGTSTADGEQPTKIQIQLLDKAIGARSDHTDVGLQSWGASIVFSDLLCASPERFGLTTLCHAPRVLELGAGTGLVALTLAKLFPLLGSTDAKIVATDYHAAVLANLKDNVTANFPDPASPSLKACILDWATPTFDAPLDEPADLIVATDVIYAPEHAIWLRDCVAAYLAPNALFWLMVAHRRDGKFEGISDTVTSAFSNPADLPRDKAGRALSILSEERVEKRRGIGRGDESHYNLFKIGWSAQ